MISKMVLVITALLFYGVLQTSKACIGPVSHCPIDEQEWKRRGSEFTCPSANQTYVCIFKGESDVLIEACMADILISSETVGCPIAFCVGPIAVPPLPEYFRPCPSNKTGCPPSDHPGYSLHELYKYPACITKEQGVAGTTTTAPSIKDKTSRSLEYGLGFGIPIGVLILSGTFVLGMILYRRRWKGYRKKSKRRPIFNTPLPTVSDSYDRMVKEVRPHKKSEEAEKTSMTDLSYSHNGIRYEGKIHKYEASMAIIKSYENDPVYEPPQFAQEKIVSELQRKGFAVIVGFRGSGKYRLALRCIVSVTDTHKPKIISNVKDFVNFVYTDTREKFVLLLRDILGKESVPKEKQVDDLEQALERVMWNIANQNWHVLIIVRDSIYPIFERCLGRYDRFTKENVFMLSDPIYIHSVTERKTMVQNYARRYNVVISENLMSQIAETKPLDFPLRCAEFFKKSKGGVVNNIDQFTFCGKYTLEKIEKLSKSDSDTFCALVSLLLLSNGDQFEVPTGSSYNDDHEKVIQTLDEVLGAHVNDLSGLMRILDHQINIYVMKRSENSYTFTNDMFEQAVLLTFGRMYPDTLLDIASLDILKRCAMLGSDEKFGAVHIPKRLRQKYMKMLAQKGK